MEKEIRTIFWEDRSVVLIDQRALPLTERYVTCSDYHQVIAAINDLTIRGAPAIGVAAAMGIALGVLNLEASSPDAFRQSFDALCGQFAATRPTARNLFWAIDRMKRRFDSVFCATGERQPGPDAAARKWLERTRGPRRLFPAAGEMFPDRRRRLPSLCGAPTGRRHG